MYKIVITDDDGKTIIVPLTRAEITIGRAIDNTIVLSDRNVSRRHAVFSTNENGFYIRDLGSRTGVWIDGAPIGDEPCRVIPEERFFIGNYTLSLSTRKYGVPLGVQLDPKTNKGMGKVTPYARFVMVAGPTPGMEVDLVDELYIIGRSDRANVHIDDPSISRAHARLEGKNAHWIVSDLDSINGLYVNGIKRDDYQLRSGDVVDFGKIQFRYVAPGEPFDLGSERKRKNVDDIDELMVTPFKVYTVVMSLALLGLLAVWGKLHFFSTPVQSPAAAREVMGFNEIIARGEQAMSEARWEEAARLFAQAQQINADSFKARKLKQRATKEMESQNALNAAVAARDAEQWDEAMAQLKLIDVSSRYYDQSLIQMVADHLCEDLLYRAEFMITAEDPKAAAELGKIGELLGASPDCLARRDDLQQLLNIVPTK